MKNFRNLRTVFFYSIGLAVMLLAACSKQGSRIQDKLLDAVINEYANYISERKTLQLCATGAAAMDKIEKITIQFSSKDCLNSDEAAKLAVDCVNELVKQVNSSETIRPYLAQTPFTPQNVQISLVFLNGKEFVSNSHIASAWVSAGKVTLNKYNKQREQLEELSCEDFDAANQRLANL